MFGVGAATAFALALGVKLKKAFDAVKGLFGSSVLAANTTSTAANTAALEANTVALGGKAAGGIGKTIEKNAKEFGGLVGLTEVAAAVITAGALYGLWKLSTSKEPVRNAFGTNTGGGGFRGFTGTNYFIKPQGKTNVTLNLKPSGK